MWISNHPVCVSCGAIPLWLGQSRFAADRPRWPQIFLTFRHYKGGSSSAKRTGRLYHRRYSWYSLSEAESTSGHMVLSGVPRKKSPVTPPGIDPGTVRLVAQHLNHYATPGPSINKYWSSYPVRFTNIRQVRFISCKERHWTLSATLCSTHF